MGTTTFVSLVSYVIAHGYFIFFVACFLEGPIVTMAAGVAVALGYYNLPLIILISILGDLVPDAVYYSVGYFGGRPLISKYGNYIGLTPERISNIRNLLHKNMTKTMIFVKLSPIIPVPGLILIGSLHANIKKFMKISLLITVPKSLLLVCIGYFVGKAYVHFSGLFSNIPYLIFGTVVVIFGVYYAYNAITKRVAKTISSKSL